MFNPHRGSTASLTDEVSSKALRSDFTYQLITLDAARFFPIRRATLALHARAGTTTGAIPSTKLFTFSDQELRGYSTVYYGTDSLLGQVELRIPLTADRAFAVVPFADGGGARVRGGSALGSYTFHSDVGGGLRFDVPALGLRTLRLDFAKGSQGLHTSFGIGQAF